MNQIWLNAVRASARAVAPWYLAGGAHAPILAYQAKGAASMAVAKVNLVNPGTNDLVEVGTPAWDPARGFNRDSSIDNYLRTNYTPPATDQDYTVIIQFVDGGAGFGTGFGTGVRNRLYVFSRPTANTDTVYGNGAAKSVPGAITAGNMAVSGDIAYFNGSPLAGAITAGTTARAEMFVVAVNGLANNQDGYFVAGALYRPALSAAQTAAVAAAMAAL